MLPKFQSTCKYGEAVMFLVGMRCTVPIRTGTKPVCHLSGLSYPCSSFSYNKTVLKRSSVTILCLHCLAQRFCSGFLWGHSAASTSVYHSIHPTEHLLLIKIFLNKISIFIKTPKPPKRQLDSFPAWKVAHLGQVFCKCHQQSRVQELSDLADVPFIW